jgi:heptosyltransferase-1
MRLKSSVDAGSPLRVLIVRIGAMGDVLHAMPAVAALRELHPEWFIGWAIEPGWSELLQVRGRLERMSSLGDSLLGQSAGRPLVDVVHPVSAKAWAKRPFASSTWREVKTTRRELSGSEYDVCVDMQGALKSAVVGRMAGAKMFVGAAEPREVEARWLYGKRVAVNAAHVVDQGCELLGGALGETLRQAKVTLPVDEETEAWCDGLLESVVGRGQKFAFIAPTAGWGAKQWPAARYGAVAAELGKAGFRTLVNVASTGETGGRVVAASAGADRGGYRAVASGCGAGEAGGGAVWADGSGAEWSVCVPFFEG